MVQGRQNGSTLPFWTSRRATRKTIFVYRSYSLPRVLFLAAAFDSLAAGIWSLGRPGDLFALLDIPMRRDAFLWSVLGGLCIAQAGFLIFAARRPADAGFAWVVITGRALQSGVWLWLFGSERVHAAPLPLALLTGHDLAILALVATGLVLARRSP
jgi:hypothetical protein